MSTIIITLNASELDLAIRALIWAGTALNEIRVMVGKTPGKERDLKLLIDKLKAARGA